MIFNSLVFVLFFAVVLVVNSLLRQWGARKLWLLVVSYLFYAAWNPPFVVLLWLSTVVDWFVGKAMFKAETKSKKKRLLWISLGVNLGLLAYFKYAGFFVASTEALLGFGGIAVEWGVPDIILPMGISFYTFQTLSYTVSRAVPRRLYKSSRVSICGYVDESFRSLLLRCPFKCTSNGQASVILHTELLALSHTWRTT